MRRLANSRWWNVEISVVAVRETVICGKLKLDAVCIIPALAWDRHDGLKPELLD